MTATYSELNYNDNPIDTLLKKCCINEYFQGFYLYGEKQHLIPKYHINNLNQVENFNVREDDVYVMGFTRSGTTLTQETIWLINNDFDFETAKSFPLKHRFPLFEFFVTFDEEQFKIVSKSNKFYHLNEIDKRSSPRFIKTHLPRDLLPKEIREKTVEPKIVYIAREPKSVCLSNYHFHVSYKGFTGTLDDFCELFLNDRIPNCPYWEHISAFWNERNNENILYLTYKELVTDMENTIRKMCSFFNKKPSDDNISKLKEHLQFEKMKKNPCVNYDDMVSFMSEIEYPIKKSDFIRKGKIDSFKEEMKQEYIDKFDNWIKENLDKYNLPIECINN